MNFTEIELIPTIVIPARYSSSRFEGKPLAKILGKPMIQWVAERASLAYGANSILIATDSKEIAKAVDKNYNCILTSVDNKTGTDRVAEAVDKIKCSEIIVNVQGDEPLIDYLDIIKITKCKMDYMDHVVNGMSIAEEDEIESLKTVKVATKLNGDLLYASRSCIPYKCKNQFKQIGIYAFSKWQLQVFSSFKHKTPCESTEDIEIIRFLEANINVKMQIVSCSYSVDYPDDIAVVEKKLKNEIISD